jgi:hypothetical protein
MFNERLLGVTAVDSGGALDAARPSWSPWRIRITCLLDVQHVTLRLPPARRAGGVVASGLDSPTALARGSRIARRHQER